MLASMTQLTLLADFVWVSVLLFICHIAVSLILIGSCNIWVWDLGFDYQVKQIIIGFSVTCFSVTTVRSCARLMVSGIAEPYQLVSVKFEYVILIKNDTGHIPSLGSGFFYWITTLLLWLKRPKLQSQKLIKRKWNKWFLWYKNDSLFTWKLIIFICKYI